MKTTAWRHIFAGMVFIFFAAAASAQIVDDGNTRFINAASVNITGNITVGTNLSLTSLVITNGGAITNTGNGQIAFNASSTTDSVIVTGTNSVWSCNGNMYLGEAGSFNSFTITNGGTVLNGFANIGQNSGGFNVMHVIGAKSLWVSANALNVGNIGFSNQLIVANGGTVTSGGVSHIGNASVGNLAWITDTGSTWTAPQLDIGATTNGNRLIVTNGGKVFITTGINAGANTTASGLGTNNLILVTGAGSALTNNGTGTYFGVGGHGIHNQLIITNGAWSVALRSASRSVSLPTGATT